MVRNSLEIRTAVSYWGDSIPLLRSSALWVDLLSKKNWSKVEESHKHDGGQAVLFQVFPVKIFFGHITWGGEISFFKKLSGSPPTDSSV